MPVTKEDLRRAASEYQKALQSGQGCYAAAEAYDELRKQYDSSPRLEMTASGRYDVYSSLGRVGEVIGGKNRWQARVASMCIGYFPTKKAAASAVVAYVDYH